MLSVKLNTTFINKTIICFESRTFLSYISTVRVDILIGMANFYIVNTFTLFFLCLKDMNIFGVYLNNITNQLIY